MRRQVTLTFALIVGVTQALAASGCSSASDLYFIKGARVVGTSPDVSTSPLDRKRAGEHRIEPDSNTVLVMREWERGGFWNMEDQRYRKLTVELPGAVVGQMIDVQAPGVAVFFSEGRTGSKFQRCGGTKARGTITIDHFEEESLRATLSLVLECEPAMLEKPARSVQLSGRFQFQRMSVGELGPWTDGGLDWEAVTPP